MWLTDHCLPTANTVPLPVLKAKDVFTSHLVWFRKPKDSLFTIKDEENSNLTWNLLPDFLANDNCDSI